MTIRIAPKARRDLAARIAYLATENPRAAWRFVEAFFKLVDDLAEGGFDGPEQRLRTGEVVRSWPLPPLRLYYQRAPDGLRILRIYHQARRPVAR